MLDIKGLIKEAADRNASDIHISVGASPRFRINGELLDTGFSKMTPADTLEVLLSLMSPEQREIFEEKKEIDLSVTIPETGRFRVNAYRQRGLITITLRLVDVEIPDAESLKIPEQVLRLCNERRGLILVTGPSGSGKSTVLASLIDRINSERALNIITIEDPIEYVFTNKMSIVNQREIGVDTTDHLSAMNSALRQDPDVLEIGEIGSEEEADAALTAAETGRLVFSSLFTMGAVQTIEYLIDLFPEQRRRQAAGRIANVLRAVVSRQLVRTVDSSLIPAYEILLTDNGIREMIRENRTGEIREYMEKNGDKGLITMDSFIYKLCKEGLISAEEAVSASFDEEAMAAILQSTDVRSGSGQP